MSITADVDGLGSPRFDSEQEQAATRLQEHLSPFPKRKGSWEKEEKNPTPSGRSTNSEENVSALSIKSITRRPGMGVMLLT
jgi:hypothetical protein